MVLNLRCVRRLHCIVIYPFALFKKLPEMTSHLYTFGYEGLDIDSFMDRLVQAGVDTIVDVRELPLSRKKGFSKNALREQLTLACIEYFHIPALGCPKDIRNRYRQNDDWQQYTQDFMLHLHTQDDTVRSLAQMSKTSTACLICFEADFTTCHRTYVARAAHRFGAPSIKHLTAKTAFLDQALRVAA
jgi:uncharacterized protein (DUF488 family)